MHSVNIEHAFCPVPTSSHIPSVTQSRGGGGGRGNKDDEGSEPVFTPDPQRSRRGMTMALLLMFPVVAAMTYQWYKVEKAPSMEPLPAPFINYYQLRDDLLTKGKVRNGHCASTHLST